MKALYYTFVYEGRQVLKKQKQKNQALWHHALQRGDFPRKKIDMVGFEWKQE